MPSIFVDRGCGPVAETPSRHQPGEHVKGEPPGLHHWIPLQQSRRLLHRRPEDADAAPGLVGLTRKRTVDQGVPGLAHPCVESQVAPLELRKLFVAERRRAGRPAKQDDGVSVEPHYATLTPCRRPPTTSAGRDSPTRRGGREARGSAT